MQQRCYNGSILAKFSNRSLVHRVALSAPLCASLDDMEPLKGRQHSSNVFAIVVQATSIIGLLKSLVRLAATHVSMNQ